MNASRKYLARALLSVPLLTPLAARAADWTIDAAQSSLSFSGEQTGERFTGKFTRFAAIVVFDPERLDASHIAVTIDLASAVTGDQQRDTALPETDWFDVGQYPQARFESSSIRRKDDGTYEAMGDLALRGVARLIVLSFKLDIDGARAHAKGHVDLLRDAFGVGQGVWSTGQWVALEVGVDVDIVATDSAAQKP